MEQHKRTWEPDPLKIREAREILGIEQPITFKFTQQLRTAGKHGWRDGEHVILLSTYLTEDQASRTIWHELAHAAQQERFGDGREGCRTFISAYKTESRMRGYELNAFEVEARTASDFAEDVKLTRRIGSISLKPWKADQ